MNIQIRKELMNLAERCEGELSEEFKKVDRIKSSNFYKVLDAFRESHISVFHFRDTTGYGLSDPGRDKVEEVYKRIFKTEAALVRPQIVSGTHAISISFFGLLRPADTLLYLSGDPYETGEAIIGLRKVTGSLKEYGIKFDKTDMTKNIGEEKIKRAAVGVIQRSGGYSYKKSLTIGEISRMIKKAKAINPNICIMVDNCYGEFVDEKEPTKVGADIVVGSLIKNMGGAITPTGGYIVGKEKYIKKIEAMLTAPGTGREIGPMLSLTRLFLQGVFFAPLVVSNALKGAIFAAKFFKELGYNVKPLFNEERGDIVQAILLGSPEKLVMFTQAVQTMSPIDWDAEVLPSPLAGYKNDILMAAGTFIQGSSIELSADAPMREPYAVYLQGGIYYEHSKLASLFAAEKLIELEKKI
ncbi:MAG: methionine gamma-lyase family protein [Caldisericaceae bacterium]|nr:methionine gamma-lyase family protein [Caldisericaceae bacterium]